jgi:hypothetical protein
MLADLYWWAWHIAIRAINAAVTGLWFQQDSAALALVEKLARIDRHNLFGRMAARRADQCRTRFV